MSDYSEMAEIVRERDILPADKARNLERITAYYQRAAPSFAADPLTYAARITRGLRRQDELRTFYPRSM